MKREAVPTGGNHASMSIADSIVPWWSAVSASTYGPYWFPKREMKRNPPLGPSSTRAGCKSVTFMEGFFHDVL